MALAQRLAVRQSQSLVMTPQLSLSIKLLAMSNLELANFVDEQLEKNPFLEHDHGRQNEREETVAPSFDTSGQDNEPLARERSDKMRDQLSTETLERDFGTNFDNAFEDDKRLDALATKSPKEAEFTSQSGHRGRELSHGRLSGTDDDLVARTAAPVDLASHIIAQLSLSAADQTEHAVAKAIAYCLDDNGYLDTPPPSLATRFGVSEVTVGSALKLIQTCEPAGVGATSLKQCLELQLRAKNRLDPAMETLLENLTLLAKRDFEALKSLTDLSMADLMEAVREIKALDPKPGAVFSSGNAQTVVPDVIITETPEGGWRVELNNDVLPKVLVNNRYAKEIKPALAKDEDQKFMSDCLQDANWLTKSLDQRAQTILKVTEEIVRQQDGFLLHGVRQLRPLTLKTVADAIDMHESSVSRVTTKKFVMTPRGVFPMKYFFTAAINSTGSEKNHSAESVRDQIKDMIAKETASTVLSDDAIVDALKASGIAIARRTIAKYRDAMQIPSSVQRKREKRALETLQ